MPVEKVQLVSSRSGNYTIYVFKKENSDEFIMCTKPPNWKTPEIFIGDKGYVKYEEVTAGNHYTTPDGETNKYKYSAVYFLDFILDNNTVKEKELIL